MYVVSELYLHNALRYYHQISSSASSYPDFLTFTRITPTGRKPWGSYPRGLKSCIVRSWPNYIFKTHESILTNFFPGHLCTKRVCQDQKLFGSTPQVGSLGALPPGAKIWVYVVSELYLHNAFRYYHQICYRASSYPEGVS